MGCVFSPFYYRARQEQAAADPEDHPAMNVVLYGPGRKKTWVLTEWHRGALRRSPEALIIGPNRLTWEGETLVVRFDERAAPIRRTVRGTVRLTPHRRFNAPLQLDEAGRHHWWAVAPLARAEVRLDRPDVSYSGSAYHDTNWGQEPLEAGFQYWNWSRAELPGAAAVLYDVQRRHGSERFGRLFREDGTVETLEAPTDSQLPATRIFRIPRQTRIDGGAARVARTLEDTPFYSRSILETSLAGHTTTGMHESVDLDRFVKGSTQWMLPWKMKRRVKGTTW